MTHPDHRPPRRPAGGDALAATGAPPGRSRQPAAPAAAITVDRARTDPIPIAIPPMGGDLGAQITGVISDDLQRSGLFKPWAAAPRRATRRTSPLEGDRRAGAGDRQRHGSGPGSSSGCGTCLPGSRSRAPPTPPRRQLAPHRAHHRRRDLRAAAGREGLFRHPHRLCRRLRRRATAGSSGWRSWTRTARTTAILTDGSWLVLTPRFHPTRDEIVFMSYANNRPRVYSFDLGSGRSACWANSTASPLRRGSRPTAATSSCRSPAAAGRTSSRWARAAAARG